MAKATHKFDRLAAAMAAGTLVCVSRAPLDCARIVGYVHHVGHQWVVLGVVGCNIRYDGFSALRLSELISIVAPYENAPFVELALSLRGESQELAEMVDCSSLTALLRTVSAAFPLVTIHREFVNQNECDIGRVEEVSPTTLVLRGIGPDARWHETPTTIDLADVTRVDFGGGYEAALDLVNQNI
jgi:hypothetical protein